VRLIGNLPYNISTPRYSISRATRFACATCTSCCSSRWSSGWWPGPRPRNTGGSRWLAGALRDEEAVQRRQRRVPAATQGGIGAGAPRASPENIKIDETCSRRAFLGAAQDAEERAAGSGLCRGGDRPDAQAREPLASGLCAALDELDLVARRGLRRRRSRSCRLSPARARASLAAEGAHLAAGFRHIRYADRDVAEGAAEIVLRHAVVVGELEDGAPVLRVVNRRRRARYLLRRSVVRAASCERRCSTGRSAGRVADAQHGVEDYSRLPSSVTTRRTGAPSSSSPTTTACRVRSRRRLRPRRGPAYLMWRKPAARCAPSRQGDARARPVKGGTSVIAFVEDPTATRSSSREPRIVPLARKVLGPERRSIPARQSPLPGSAFFSVLRRAEECTTEHVFIDF